MNPYCDHRTDVRTMALTCTPSRGNAAVVTNQQRDAQRRADRQFTEEAVEHLRSLCRHAVSAGWTAKTGPDGERLIIAHAGTEWEEPLAETRGDWAEPVQAFLLAAQPGHLLHLLPVLEHLSGAVAQGALGSTERGHLIRWCEAVLGRKYKAPAGRLPA